MGQVKTEFSRIRSFFWPIHWHELPKFIPMMVLFFLISINYHLLRITKDTLVMSAPEAGAEVIPFLKLWAMLPMAFVMTYVFTQCTHRFTKEKVFVVITTIFLVFFALFALFLFPQRDFLYLDSLVAPLKSILPKGGMGFISIIRYWPMTLYYVMAESWSTMMVSLLLWGFANDVTKVSEAKRFYALFGIGINSAGIIAGKFGAILASHMESSTKEILPLVRFLGGKTPWDQTLIIFLGIILLCGFGVLAVHKYLHIKVFPKRRYEHFQEMDLTKKQKKLSLIDSLVYVGKSPYLLFIALIVLSFHIVIHFTEILWKSQVRELISGAGDLAIFMSQITFYVGIFATFASYFISGNVIRKFGWKNAALVTPAIIIFTGMGFFTFLFLNRFPSPASLAIFGLSPLALTVFFGSIQNVLSRSAKYTLFDDTKEMAFIPLSDHSKITGKAAIDGIGSRLGKSGGALVLQIIFLFFGTAAASAPIILGIIFAVVCCWIVAIYALSKRFESLTRESPSEKETPVQASPIVFEPEEATASS